MISDMTSRQILDAIDRTLEEILQRFAREAAVSSPVSTARHARDNSDDDNDGEVVSSLNE